MSALKKKIPTPVLNYADKTLDLKTLKQKDLKEILKFYHLHTSGNKPVLIDRITALFNKNIKVVLLQKVLRGFFVRLFFKLKGKVLLTESFVNDTDFYTMDPLKEIQFFNLIKYTDEKRFVYAFNIQSLISLYFQTGKITNPYNRNKFPLQTVLNIFSLYGLIKIIFGVSVDGLMPTSKIPGSYFFKRQNHREQYYTQNEAEIVEIQNTIRRHHIHNNIVVRLGPRLLEQRLSYLREIGNRPLNTRIEELFIEIDLLGNYTVSSWFTSLSPNSLRNFYMDLRDVWNHKANIYPETKRRIYPFGDLFTVNYDLITLTEFPPEDLKNICVTLMEKLVFSALDREDRVLATNYVLMALTSVSPEARRQYIWLFESINW